MNKHEHSSKQYEQEITALRARVVEMGALVEKQLADALQALLRSDLLLADKVIEQDQLVDSLEMEIDNDCAQIIAKRQPQAGDLRMVLATAKIVTDIERCGDKARKLARLAKRLPHSDSDDRFARNQVQPLSITSFALLRSAVQAFDNGDSEAAIAVIRANRLLNRESSAIGKALIAAMIKNPENAAETLDFLGAIRAVDRVGDHAENIAEQVIYLVKGIDVRHNTLNEIERELSHD